MDGHLMRLRLISRSGRRASHAAFVAYGEWRRECIAVRDAYRRWATASTVEEHVAFDAYRAAVDREEHAAWRYAQLVRDVAQPRQIGMADRLVHAKAGGEG
jgi:hypothetical protein